MGIQFQLSFHQQRKPNIQEEQAPVMPTIPMLGKT